MNIIEDVLRRLKIARDKINALPTSSAVNDVLWDIDQMADDVENWLRDRKVEG